MIPINCKLIFHLIFPYQFIPSSCVAKELLISGLGICFLISDIEL